MVPIKATDEFYGQTSSLGKHSKAELQMRTWFYLTTGGASSGGRQCEQSEEKEEREKKTGKHTAGRFKRE